VRDDYRLCTESELTTFVRDVLTTLGVRAADAATVADVLVAADLRGIEAQGVARLVPDCVERLRGGTVDPLAEIGVTHETATSIAFDAGNGLGYPAAKHAMSAVLQKAQSAGVAFATVRNSNAFGIAGYYAMLALERDMIGIASTTAPAAVAPTYGSEALFGANPLAYALPALEEPAFVLDFATTEISHAKLGGPANAPAGPLAPLGGFGVDNGGHKGYGLGILVEIMCALLGGAFRDDASAAAVAAGSGAISHFFGAIRIDGFRDVIAFKSDVDRELRAFKQSQPAPGFERIYVAGELEHERTLAHRATGIPIHPRVWSALQSLAADLHLRLL
jgi:LDH2 family malate/lactate/ureidoglycolate dehydrogenase